MFTFNGFYKARFPVSKMHRFLADDSSFYSKTNKKSFTIRLRANLCFADKADSLSCSTRKLSVISVPFRR